MTPSRACKYDADAAADAPLRKTYKNHFKMSKWLKKAMTFQSYVVICIGIGAAPPKKIRSELFSRNMKNKSTLLIVDKVIH